MYDLTTEEHSVDNGTKENINEYMYGPKTQHYKFKYDNMKLDGRLIGSKQETSCSAHRSDSINDIRHCGNDDSKVNLYKVDRVNNYLEGFEDDSDFEDLPDLADIMNKRKCFANYTIPKGKLH